MSDIAKLFKNGRSQAVRLPRDYRFECEEVFIRRDPDTGDVILSVRPDNWDDFFALQGTAEAEGFLTERDESPPVSRDPFA